MSTRSISADYISAALGELDDRIFAEAYLTDSAEKMKELIRKERGEKLRSAFCVRNLKRVGALAACCAAAMAIVISVPYIVRFAKQALDLDGVQTVPPSYEAQPPHSSRVTIDSIDKLNYYSAQKILGTTLPNGASASSGEDKRIFGSYLSTSGATQNIVFLPTDIFTVTNVSYFALDVNAGSFIADAVGEGRVEVVVTQNSLADMITFKNGERFYSCVSFASFDTLDSERSFYSANSVNGFSISRTDTPTGYRFDVIFENGCAVDLRCVEIATNTIKSFDAVKGSSVSSNGGASFTVSSLEVYINERKGDGTVDASEIDTDTEDREDKLKLPTDLYRPSEAELGNKVQLNADLHLGRWYNSANENVYIEFSEISDKGRSATLCLDDLEREITVSRYGGYWGTDVFQFDDKHIVNLEAYEHGIVISIAQEKIYFDVYEPNLYAKYAGVFGFSEDYRGTLEFPNVSVAQELYVAKWNSATLGDHVLNMSWNDNGELDFESADGAIGGSIELYGDKIFIKVEYSSLPEVLLSSYMFDIKGGRG